MWFAFGFFAGAVISHVLTHAQLSAEVDRLTAELDTSTTLLRDAIASETKQRT